MRIVYKSIAVALLLSASYPTFTLAASAGASAGARIGTGSAGAMVDTGSSSGATVGSASLGTGVNSGAASGTATGLGTAGSTPANISGNNTVSNTGTAAVAEHSPAGTTPAGTTNDAASWNNQNQYWQTNYSTRPYYTSGSSYSNYSPAYRYGVDLYNQNGGQTYNALNQTSLGNGWKSMQNGSNLNWNSAQAATQDAYTRLYNQDHTTTVTGVNSTSPTQVTTGSSPATTSTAPILYSDPATTTR